MGRCSHRPEAAWKSRRSPARRQPCQRTLRGFVLSVLVVAPGAVRCRRLRLSESRLESGGRPEGAPDARLRAGQRLRRESHRPALRQQAHGRRVPFDVGVDGSPAGNAGQTVFGSRPVRPSDLCRRTGVPGHPQSGAPTGGQSPQAPESLRNARGVCGAPPGRARLRASSAWRGGVDSPHDAPPGRRRNRIPIVLSARLRGPDLRAAL